MNLLTYFPDAAEPLDGIALRRGLPLKEAYRRCIRCVEALHRDVVAGERPPGSVTQRLTNKYQSHADAIQILMLRKPQLVGAAS